MAEANPFADLIPKGGANPFADLIPAKAAAEPADHGLSERQKLSPVGKALSPITGYPETYQRMNKEAQEQVSHGVDQITASDNGAWETAKGVGNVALGTLGYVASPINAAYRSVIGQPVEDVTGIPREYTEFAAQLATPGIGLPGAAKAPKQPGFATAPTVQEAVPASEGIAGAASRLAETGNPVDVPRAMTSDSMIAQRTGQAIRNIPIVGDAIPKATARLGEQLEGATSNIASEFGGGSGQNVAHKIGQTISSAAEQEAMAAKSAAAQSDAAVLADWERSVRNTNEAIAGREQGALQSARQALGDMSPQDMGETLIARLRQGEQEARANKERLYGIAGNSDAAIDGNAVRNIRKDVSRSLDEQGVFIDPGPNLTPAAARMIQELDNVPVQNVVSRRLEPPKSPAATPKPKSPDGPEPQSLTEFLASKGGLGPDSELEAIGANNHTVNVPGAGRRKLTRQGGLPLDYAREAAEEAGYLKGDHKGTSTTRDLLDAIDAEMRGNKRYAQGYEGTVNKRTAVARSEREQYEYAQRLSAIEDEKAVSDFPGDRAIARPVSVQGLEQTRKRLGAIKQTATNDADRRAAGQVMRAYDDWIDNAFDNALFSGSDEALDAYKAARAANTEWRQRFGFNARDDADRVVNRIVTGEVTPQEAANYIVGATKVGSKGVSSRLITRITEATGGDPEAMNAIRAGVWNRLSQSTEGVAGKAGAKVADDISEFLNGSGRDVANRLFSEPQRNIARAYADTLRRGAQAREAAGDIAANTKPGQMEVGVGPFQSLAKAVLGGGRTDEALYSAINSYAKSGSKGDINLLSKVLQVIPQAERGNLASAVVRDMGVSPRTKQFSPDVFVSAWNTYRPEAKDLLFGMSGPQRRALDDIAMISQRMKDVGSKFGNPSGTAQNVNAAGLGTAAVTSFASLLAGNPVPALTLVSGVVGGAAVAKILASPVGASNVSKWARVYERAAKLPSPSNLNSLERATGLLAINISHDTGMPIKDIVRQLQGPVPAGAENEKR